MNTLNRTLSTILILLALAPSGALLAKEEYKLPHKTEKFPVYERRIASISTQDNSCLGGHIVLDDGSSWELVGYLLGKDSDLKKWKKGEEVEILWSPPKSKGIFCMAHLQKDGQPILLLESDTLKYFPTVAEIINDGEFIKLSDGTLWEFTWWGKGSTKHWASGQHVMVQGKGKKNSYSLTNLDLVEESLINSKFANGTFVKFE